MKKAMKKKPIVLGVGEEVHLPGHPDFEDGKPIRLRRMLVSELKHAPYNPRVISEEEITGLTNALGEFGLSEIGVVWNEKTGIVIGGHQRLKVLVENNWTDTLVVIKSLSPDQEKMLNLTLNNQRISGSYDWPKVAEMLPSVMENHDLPSLGWPEHITGPLLAADFTPPDVKPLPTGEGGGLTMHFTKEQGEKVMTAIHHASKMDDEPKSDEERLVWITENWMSR